MSSSMQISTAIHFKPVRLPFRRIGLTLGMLLCLFAGHSVHAQVTTNPIRIIYPAGPGGVGDALARIVAEALKEDLDRPVLVENRAGAGARIGIQAVKAAAADGSTLLVTPNSPMTIYQYTYRSPGYDAYRDFAPITQLATFDFALAIAPSVPVTTLKELVTFLKANPSFGNFGSPGVGSTTHFLGFLFGHKAGLSLQHVAYRGAAEALNDLMASQLPLLLTTTAEVAEQYKAGAVKVLATSGLERSPLLRAVPIFKEVDYDIQADGWYGLFAPADTPAEFIQRYNKIVVRTLSSPEIKKKIMALGLQATGTSPAGLSAAQRAESALWEPIIKASGFVPQ